MSSGFFRDTLVAALQSARGPVILEPGSRTSGPDLLAESWGAAAWLDDHGARPGSPVAALLYGSAESFALATGGALTDRPLAALNPKMTTHELDQIVSNLSPSLLVIDPRHRAAADALTGHTATVAMPDQFGRGARRSVPNDPEGTVAILHTSGTTGVPKPVPIADRAMLAKARATALAYEISPGDMLCTVPPFHHMSGLIMGWSTLASGGGIAPVPWFSIDVWQQYAETHPSHVLLVPTMIEMLMRANSLPQDVQVIAYGGSPIHPALLRAVMAHIPAVRFVQVYGQTEGSPLTKLSHEDHLLALAEPGLLASAGRGVAGLDLRLDHPDDAGVGEIVVRADHLFGAAPGTELATGDFGRMDDRGYVFLVGRKGDKIIRGGENVYPLEVERVLESHPRVREAAIIGVPDARLGEVLKAVIVATDAESAPTPDELSGYVRERLSGFKVPSHWAFSQSLPRNPSGKLLRRMLVEPETPDPHVTEAG